MRHNLYGVRDSRNWAKVSGTPFAAEVSSRIRPSLFSLESEELVN